MDPLKFSQVVVKSTNTLNAAKVRATKIEFLALYPGFDGMVKNISRYCPFNQHYFKIFLIKQHCPFPLASCYSKLLFATVIAVSVNITDICKPRKKDH